MGLHQTKDLLNSKENSHQTLETAHRMEKICASYSSDKGIISRIYREFKNLSLQRINNPIRIWAHKLNREFSKEKVKMASKYMKKCSTSLVIKEIQIKTISRFHLTPVRSAIIKGNYSNKCW
jgi:hypothetical protein